MLVVLSSSIFDRSDRLVISGIGFDTARLYFELKRKEIAVRSNIERAIAHNLLLYHCDRDFEQIAKYTVLKAIELDL